MVALALQYVGVFILTAFSWPLEMALVKLVAGWMVSAILGAGMALSTGSHDEADVRRLSSQILRFLFALLVGLAIYSNAPGLRVWLPKAGLEAVIGSMILMGMGLLHLGMSSHPFRVIVSLLTIFAGFEILYASLEISTLVAALLAVINLGLAFVGVYLLVAPTVEAVE